MTCISSWTMKCASAWVYISGSVQAAFSGWVLPRGMVLSPQLKYLLAVFDEHEYRLAALA